MYMVFHRDAIKAFNKVNFGKLFQLRSEIIHFLVDCQAGKECQNSEMDVVPNPSM